MLRSNALRPRMNHIDVGALKKMLRRPCRDCSHEHHSVCIPTGTVHCTRCGRVSSVRAAPKPARRAVTPRPAVRSARVSSAPRPREGGARVVAAGRDGAGGRDDGGGSGSDDGPGDGPPPPRLGARYVLERAGRRS
jgi:hypothetical protein